jgi:hypothetical protein
MNTTGVPPFFENWTSPATFKVSYTEVKRTNSKMSNSGKAST